MTICGHYKIGKTVNATVRGHGARHSRQTAGFRSLLNPVLKKLVANSAKGHEATTRETFRTVRVVTSTEDACKYVVWDFVVLRGFYVSVSNRRVLNINCCGD